MSFFKRIIDFFKADPTRNWPVSARKMLTFNISDRTVNGTTFGHSFEALEIFGKPDNEKPVYDKVFQYLQHGLLVELKEEEKIDFFAFVFQNDECRKEERFAEARASFVNAKGGTLSLSKATCMADITVFMGEPKSIDEDEEEVILFYEIDDLRIEWELTLAKNLKRVNLFHASKMIK
ncbi:MAG: hypothetical protein WA705_05360 [Candidatus Ozemobacteraceae bacterium]